MISKFMLVLLGTSALGAAPALAQTPPAATPDTAATTNDTPAAPDPAADASVPTPPPPTPEESASNAEFLQAQVDALQGQIDALKKQIGVVQPGWKGAPQFMSDNGFTFKPKGFAQFDAGYVSTPGPNRGAPTAGLNYNNLGYNGRARRLVIGAEGSLPGGFGYKVEFDLAQAQVSYEDIVLTWQKPGSPLQVTIGNFYPLSSLDTMTSSRLTSFLERAAFTDAFGYNRRLGVAVGFTDPADRYTFTAGVWNTEINDNNYSGTVSATPSTVTSSASPNFNRTGWQASARATFSPMLGDTRLHFGANFQYRRTNRDAQNVRYRSRPFTQITDQRFVDTNPIAADGDKILGVELGAIHGPLHFVGEAQKVWVDGYRPSKTFGLNNQSGCALATCAYAGDPSFFSAYGEVGFYLTGETRGYKGGKWDRTKVLKPFDQGGIGAIQVNARVDYLDLEDRVASGAIAAPNFVNGGKQTGYELSVIWNPMDYIRFMAQYARVHVEGGPRVLAVSPTSLDPVNKTYDVDTFALRAQVEF